MCRSGKISHPIKRLPLPRRLGRLFSPTELRHKSRDKIGIYPDSNLESAGSIPARDKRGMLASIKK